MTFKERENRIVQLEGTYNNHLVQLPGHFRADQKLKHMFATAKGKVLWKSRKTARLQNKSNTTISVTEGNCPACPNEQLRSVGETRLHQKYHLV